MKSLLGLTHPRTTLAHLAMKMMGMISLATYIPHPYLLFLQLFMKV
jgi:hypothetical protein